MKKYLRAVIGTLIFLPMFPIHLFVTWLIEDGLTLGGALKETREEFLRLIKGY